MRKKTIFIAGHRGLVGRALVRSYTQRDDWQIITRNREEVNLRDERAVFEFFSQYKPEHVILSAAKVGGIKASYTHPVEFLLDNLRIQNNVIEAAWKHEVKKLLFLGSTCNYPKEVKSPIKERTLLTGKMESTNEAFSIAKIAGIRLCQAFNAEYDCNFITAIPANVYGPYDNFDPDHSHVLPALLRKFHYAVKNGNDAVTLWGTGKPKREFLYVDDLAGACEYLLDHYDENEIVNVGIGVEASIREVASIIADITGFAGKILWDTSQPDGNARRLLDVSKMKNMGWEAKTSLRQGLTDTYRWYLQTK
jgi:GDP-L-fucose synthase